MRWRGLSPALQRPPTDRSVRHALPGLPPVPNTRAKRRSPGPSCVPGVAPGPVSVSGSESSSTPSGAGRTRGSGHRFQDSLAVHNSSTEHAAFSPGNGACPPAHPPHDPQGVMLPRIPAPDRESAPVAARGRRPCPCPGTARAASAAARMLPPTARATGGGNALPICR